MIEASFLEIVWVVLTAVLGMIAIGAGMIGYWYRKVFWYERLAAIVAGGLLIYPEGISDMVGLAMFAILLALQIFQKDKTAKTSSTTNY